MPLTRSEAAWHSRWILLAALIGAFGLAADLVAEVDVSVTVLAARPSDSPPEITLVAEPADGSAAAAPVSREEYSIGPGRWTLDLPAGRWRLRAELSGYWSEEVEVDGLTSGQAVELRLWRAGVVRGILAVAPGEVLPSEVELHLEGDAYSWEVGEPPAATVSCPVVRAVWRCAVPAGRLNLILAAGRFVPHSLWEVFVEPDEVRNLGTFELELGGVIRGRVELDDGARPSRECEVRLASSRSRGGDRTDLPAAPVAVDGSFVFLGVPAREYVLSASQPDYLTAASQPVTVLGGESVEILEPLVLRRPATLELLFSPPVAPGRRGWRFAIHRLDPEGGQAAQVARGESDPNGIWIKEDLAPGTYEIRLAEKIGSGLVPQQVELPSGRTTLPIELPILLIEGQVLAGGEPLAARVTLSRPEENLRAGFDSDAEGRFSGLLPQEGLWHVRVDAAAEGIRLSLDPIEVWALGGSGVALVELRLPDTVLEGEVTDLRGDPLVAATVRIQRRGAVTGSHSARTDSEGRFRFRGLMPGSMSVMATAGRLRSQWFELVLYDGRPVPQLQLVVK